MTVGVSLTLGLLLVIAAVIMIIVSCFTSGDLTEYLRYIGIAIGFLGVKIP